MDAAATATSIIMVRPILEEGKELYRCGECHLGYTEKEWAEKCESWCGEHQSCNLAITANAQRPKESSGDNHLVNSKTVSFLSPIFYGLIGLNASLAFFLTIYFALRLDSSISNFIINTSGTPLYFWPYVILTLGAVVLFGVNISLLVYRWRKFGPPRIKGQAGGTGLGSLVGVAASACPVCGSTILATVGIAGGLAAFPLGGLELKALSLGLLVLPIWLIRKDLKKLESDCANGICPAPRNPSFKEKDKPWLVGLAVLMAVLLFVSWNLLKSEPVFTRLISSSTASKNIGIVNLKENQLNEVSLAPTNNRVFDSVVAFVLPEEGFQSQVVLGDSIVKLVENGVIDKAKFENIYKGRGGLPTKLRDVLRAASDEPILLTRSNANYYVNLIWPLGLANYMRSNESSPVRGQSLFNFASTGGWNLGREKNGGSYFNKFKIVVLTLEQEASVKKIAQNSYRPCCNNSTFFQDCNHGSALLGLLELGAAQGLSEDQLYKEALAFNSFWFPRNYVETALFFKIRKGLDWSSVDPREALGYNFSSLSGWSKNVRAEIVKIPNLIPPAGVGVGCAV